MYRKNSVILDAEKGEARVGSGEDHRRIVLMASEAFVKMIETLNAFGTAAFTMLYMMGQEKGRFDVKKEIEMLTRKGNSLIKRQVIENVIQELRITGWGVPRIQSYDEQQAVVMIIVENNPLTDVLGANRESDRPICHYLRGYWVGVFSEIFERKVSCAESRCQGMGDKFCEFKIAAE